jgi:polysaccharide pyruvyl transferase WcaK-like protein
MNHRAQKSVSIVGGTLWGNRGAEAMLVTTIGAIREEHPDCQFYVFSYYPERDKELCVDDSIEFLNYRPLNLGLKIFPLAILTWLFSLIKIRLPDWMIGREMAAIRRSDAMCDVGGITFCDGREIFLLYNVLSVMTAMLVGTPVFKMSQAMGPFKSSVNRFWANRILPKCQHVFSRGGLTSKSLESLGLETSKWSDASDVAFSYQTSFSLTDENTGRIKDFESNYRLSSEHAQQTIAIIPSSLVAKKNDQYVHQLSELIKDVVAAGNHVLLLPNATREGIEKGRNNDLVAIKSIVEELSGDQGVLDHVSAVDFDLNTDGIRSLLGLADMLVTSRFHGMVAALAGTIPVVVIGWSHKYREVLAQFDSEELSSDHESRSFSLTEQVLQVASNVEVHRNRLRQYLPGVKSSSEMQLTKVCEFLSSGQSKAPTDSNGKLIPNLPPSIDSSTLPETVA